MTLQPPTIDAVATVLDDTGEKAFASEHILVIKLSALGDFLLSLAAMKSIKEHHRDARLTLLTTRPFVDIAQRSGYFDEIWIDTRPKITDWRGWRDLYSCFNSTTFSRVYDLQMNTRTSVLYRRLFRRSCPAWSGMVEDSPLALPRATGLPMHAFERHRAILKLAGIDMGPPDLSFMTADVSLFGVTAPYVLMMPGCAPQRPEKRWPAKRFGALALKLAHQGIQVVLIGTAAEREAIDTIRAACPAALDLSGRTSFEDIAELARGARATIGNDTGPLHLASLAGSPVVALFSAASDPAQSAPVGPSVTIIQSDDMNDISVGEVYQRVMSL